MLRYLSSGVSSYLSGRDGNPSSSTHDAPPSFKEPRRSANAADDDDDDDEPPAFPLPGSIQRAGSSKTADKGDVGDNGAREEQHGEGADDDDDSDSESDDQGDHHQPINVPLDFQVSPPSPTQTNDSRASTPKAAHYPASPSTTVPPPVAYQRARPKPSHRPFPPEPEFLLAGRNSGSSSSSSSSTSPSNGARQGAYGLALPPSTTAMPPKRGKKVALKPGHSALDWARFSREEGEYLKCGMSGFERIPMSEVAEHRRRDDAWSVFHGKVYNITPYLNYHPGGVPELMRVAGRDGTELFMKTHGWVNAELMLESCLLGMLVKDAQE